MSLDERVALLAVGLLKSRVIEDLQRARAAEARRLEIERKARAGHRSPERAKAAA